MSDMRLIVAGAGGRMGRTLVRAIAETEGLTLAGAVENARSPVIGRDSGLLAGIGENGIKVAAEFGKADAIIDFTTPQATVALAAQAAQAGIIHVIGTTGFSPADDAKLAEAARSAIIVKSGNMSLGVNLLAALVKRAAKTLGEDFDIEVLEMHHNRKVDGGRTQSLAQRKIGARARWRDRAAQGRRYRLCDVAGRHGGW